jgi:hypothetical protein
MSDVYVKKKGIRMITNHVWEEGRRLYGEEG